MTIQRPVQTSQPHSARAELFVTAASRPNVRQKLRCFNCNFDGHVMNDCPKPKRRPGSCYV